MASNTIGHGQLLEGSSSGESGGLVGQEAESDDITILLVTVQSHWDLKVSSQLRELEGLNLSED
mgnify:FL=1